MIVCRPTRAFSLLETLVALCLLTVVLLGMLSTAAMVPGAAALGRLEQAGNLARSVLEQHRALPLSDPAWAPGDRVGGDASFELHIRVLQSGNRRDLLVRVIDRRNGQCLVSASLTRTEGGL
ncbi:MAG: hypothetical protein AB1758_12515 [Candidatus Eremiobacterota bacterium]